MKKITTFITSAALLAGTVLPSFASDRDARQPDVYVDNTLIEFADQNAYITDEGRTLVPARGVFEAMECVVGWNADDYTVTVTNEALKKEILLAIDDTTMKVVTDGKEEVKTIDVPAKLMNDRTMIPLRAVSEAIGCDVGWNEDAYRIDIKSVEVKKEYAPLTNKISLKSPAETVRVGDVITVPVMLSNAKGLKGVMFKITWNPKQLQMLGTNVSTSKSFEGFTDFPKLFNSFIDINQTEIVNGKLSVVCSADKIVETDSTNCVLGNLHFKVLSDAKDETVTVSFDTEMLKTAGNNGEANLGFADAVGISFAVKEKLSTHTGGSGSSRPSGSSSGNSSGSGSSSSGSGSSSGSDVTEPDNPNQPSDPDEPTQPDNPAQPDDPEVDEPEVDDPEVEPSAIFSFETSDVSEDGTVTVDVKFETTEDVNIIALISAMFSQSGVEIVGFEFSDEAKSVINTGLSNYDPATQCVVVLFNESMQFSGVIGTFTLSVPEDVDGEIVISATSDAINEGVGKVVSAVLEGIIEL